MRPISDICLIAPTGNSCALSHLPAFGASSVSAKARHMSRSILCSSLPDRSRTPSHFLHNPAPKRGRTQKGREPPQSGGGLFITRRQARVPELRVCDNGPATDTHSSLYGVQRMPPAAAVTCKMRVGGGHKRSGRTCLHRGEQRWNRLSVSAGRRRHGAPVACGALTLARAWSPPSMPVASSSIVKTGHPFSDGTQ
jgi:hypothetical protein